jgi:subfamily B ATP-binding cassette protein MsbA
MTSKTPASGPKSKSPPLNVVGQYKQGVLFRWAWANYLRKYTVFVVIALLLMTIEGSTLGAFSYMIQPMFDQVFEQGDLTSIKWVAFGVGGIFALRAITSWSHKVISSVVGARITATLQTQMLAHLLSLSPQFFQTNSPGLLIERVRGDTGVLQKIWSAVITPFFKDVVAVGSLLAVAISVDWQWTAFALLGIPVLIIPVLLLRGIIQRSARQKLVASADLTTRLDEIFHGITAIKLNLAEQDQNRRYSKSIKQFVRAFIVAIASAAAVPSIMDIIGGIGFIGVLYYGALQILDGTKTVGEFMSFFTAIALLFEPVRRLGNISGAWQTIFASLERIRAVFDQVPDIADPTNPVAVTDQTFKSNLRLNDVSLNIDDVVILQDVNITCEAGKTTALVGASGAGKTTIFNTLTRLLDVSDGAVQIGDVDVRHMKIDRLRGSISIVAQDAWLFDETIRANVLAGRPDADQAMLDAALSAAQVTDFAARLPLGIETPVGPRGSNLSGGQRQRVAIARAILRNTPILLLDEPTSALDSRSEAVVQKALDALAVGRTTVVIAHRLATVLNADKIVVLEQGRVIEEGTHAELLQLGGSYAELHALQFAKQKS